MIEHGGFSVHDDRVLVEIPDPLAIRVLLQHLPENAQSGPSSRAGFQICSWVFLQILYDELIAVLRSVFGTVFNDFLQIGGNFVVPT